MSEGTHASSGTNPAQRAVAADMASIRRDRYVVIRDLLSSRQIADVHAELSPLIEHPRVLGIIDQCLAPSYLLSAGIAIHVHPGETAQALHRDDGATRTPRPRPIFGVSAIWALDDFTESNGATEVVVGRTY